MPCVLLSLQLSVRWPARNATLDLLVADEKRRLLKVILKLNQNQLGLLAGSEISICSSAVNFQSPGTSSTSDEEGLPAQLEAGTTSPPLRLTLLDKLLD